VNEIHGDGRNEGENDASSFQRAESSVKLFGALSARATNGPARRFKESRESRPPINTRVKETVKISTCPASARGTSRRLKKQLIFDVR